MPDGSTTAAVRRVQPVVPPLDARAIRVAAHREALAALAALTEAASLLGDPDLFHRPRLRRGLHRRHLAGTDPEQLVEQLSAAAENRVAAGLLAVHSVRAELAEHPGRRPCFTPDALADLHGLLVAGDPNIPSPGGFRRSNARVTWPDGRVVIVPVAPGAELRAHVERWHAWGTDTVCAPLDAAALAMVQLLTIHPFPDANGRIARLLGQCDLVAAGLLPGLLLDLDSWVPAHRIEHDEALVAASDGELSCWGELFARAVTETARHRTATVRQYRELLDEEIARAAGDPDAAAVLAQFGSTSAVSAEWLRERIPHDPRPPLARLASRGVLTAHPRLPGALVHPRLLAILDTPFGKTG